MRVNFIYRRGRASPWGVEYYVRDGERLRRRRKFYATKADRDDYAVTLKDAAAENGMALLRMNGEEASTWLRLREFCEQRGQDPVEAVRRFMEQQGAADKSATIEAAVAAFLDDKKLQGFKSEYIYRLGHYLKQLKKAFPGRSISSLTPDELRLWLAGLTSHAQTALNYRKGVFTFLEFCCRQGWAARNPMKLVAAPKVRRPEPDFLTAAEARKLLAACEKHGDLEIAGLFALSLFAGLRASTVFRMRPDFIDARERRIVLPAAVMKGGRRHLMENLPDNFWAWLKTMPESAWDFGKRLYYSRRERAFHWAALGHRQNVFRHSFATHYCALKGEAASAAAILAQRDPRVIWEHYKGAGTRKGAIKYFAIFPQKGLAKKSR